MGSMNRLRETTGISNESKLRLAAAYAIVGQKESCAYINWNNNNSRRQGFC